MNTLKYLIPLVTSVILVGCGGSTAVTAEPAKAKMPVVKETPVVKEIPVDSSIVFSLSFTPTKAFHFSWAAVPNATSYKIKEDATSTSGYEVIKTATATDTSFDHIVPLYARLNAKYILEICVENDCTDSAEVHTSTRVAEMVDSIGYFKASDTDADDYFGSSVSLSKDGSTLAVGANKTSNGTGTGAVYVFTHSGAEWSQQTYFEANNANKGDFFGYSVSLSDDGNTLAVGAIGEDGSGADAGAAYVFTRSGVAWSQEAYLKASNAGANDKFGYSVSLSDDGHTLAVGATGESSNDSGVGRTEAGGRGYNENAPLAGAAYVFTRTFEESEAVWTELTYLKASNAGDGDGFGGSVGLNTDGNTLVVGAHGEADFEGAVYVFFNNGTSWAQQGLLKAGNAGVNDYFGFSVSISATGSTLAVGAYAEGGPTTGVNNTPRSDGASSEGSGAAYVFTRSGTTWTQQAYLKANNAEADNEFGYSVSISDDGDTLAVSAPSEGGGAAGVGVNGSLTNMAPLADAGAVYAFARSSGVWSQQAYLKASNAGEGNDFGFSVALSADGDTLAVGAWYEGSDATGVNADQENSGAFASGAVYLY